MHTIAQAMELGVIAYWLNDTHSYCWKARLEFPKKKKLNSIVWIMLMIYALLTSQVYLMLFNATERIPGLSDIVNTPSRTRRSPTLTSVSGAALQLLKSGAGALQHNDALRELTVGELMDKALPQAEVGNETRL